jgi:hypothetical protein
MRFEAIAVVAEKGRPVQFGARVLGFSESGYYRWKKRSASARSPRDAFLTEIIGVVHIAPREACTALGGSTPSSPSGAAPRSRTAPWSC